jgi:acetyl esterase/lipase
VRFRPRSGGRVRHWVSDVAMRMTAKRINEKSDHRALRAQLATLDRLFAGVDPLLLSTHFGCDHVDCEWLDLPGSRDDRVILYLHGGGFVCGVPRMQAAMVARWARALDARVLRPAYRLAPEHPFPAGPDDCFAVYEWLLESGRDPASIVIAGDSAGGTLTLLTLQRARRAGLPMPACAVLLSPATDMSAQSESFTENAEFDPMFSVESMTWLRDLYLPDRSLDTDPRVSPLHGDFSGLPPLLFQVGSIEMLRDESIRAAAKAHAAGTPVLLDLFEGMPHVFQIDAKLETTRLADALIVDFMREHARWAQAPGRAAGAR